MTRIISGKYKGRRIKAPKKLPTRPTTDMAKEALFNILRNQFHFRNLKILDLFSGTGNIAYEFGSRGCEEITAVDSHYACVQFITQTADEFEFPITAIKSDVYKFLERSRTGPYDIIFADPPYDFETKDFLRIAEICFDRNIVAEDGLLVVEHSKHTKLEEHPRFVETRHYGGNAFSFFTWPEETTDQEEEE